MIILRNAILDDLDILKFWDSQPHVKASDPDDDDWDWEKELERNPHWRMQLIAESDGIPIGMVQIINPEQEDTNYWGENFRSNTRAIDIWIGESHNLGKGYGTQMMERALGICFEDPEVTEILIDPLTTNTRAIRFYRKLGFEFQGNKSFGGQLCSVHCLQRVKWQSP